MDIRQITPRYHVGPQPAPADMAEVAAAGFTTVIANRPDQEVPPDYQVAEMEAAAKAAGLEFRILPLTHQTMTADAARQQADWIENAPGNVFAYCASGTRSTVIWALGQAQAGAMTADEILTAAAAGGYELSNLRPTLQAAATLSGRSD